MSTKTSLKYHREEQGGGWFHLYRECFDEDSTFVYLELGGVLFRAANSVDLTDETGSGSIAVRIPEDWARRLDLVSNPKAATAAQRKPGDTQGTENVRHEPAALEPVDPKREPGRTTQPRSALEWLLDERGSVYRDVDLEEHEPQQHRKDSRMSTRCTIKDARDESTGQGFHLYEDLADERDCVMLDLEGFTFDTSVSFAPSGKPEMRVRVRIPKHFARALGLIADVEKS